MKSDDRTETLPKPIYPAREDTELLLPFAEAPLRGRMLEIGCGNGRLSLVAARRGISVVATDRNPFALRRLAQIARDEQLPLECLRTDLALGLGRFGRILANPPYLPTEAAARDPDPWQNLATDGGIDGCSVTARILAILPDHLTPSGVAYLVISSVQAAAGVASLRERWLASGGRQRSIADRALEGERLEVWLLDLGETSEGSR